MTTVKQLLEIVFEKKGYHNIDIITFGPDDVDPSNFKPMLKKLKFKIGERELRIIVTNADDSDPNDKDGKDIACIAAAALMDLELYLFGKLGLYETLKIKRIIT